jgi:nucleoside-diphosphate-sugar epimerase
VRAAVTGAAPEVVIHQLTSLPARIDPRKMERDFVMNDRLRSEGTRHLVVAAQAAGARRVIAQSIAFAYAPGAPGTLHGEEDPLYLDAPKDFRRSAHALHDLETSVLGAGGVVLRYGYFYGPGSSIAPDGSMADDLSRRRMPIVGAGGGVWSFVHVDDAARATIAALDERVPSGAYNIVDDEPAPVREWLPALAQAVGAPRPMKVPVLVARLAAGSYGTAAMTSAQGASNERAKRDLGWRPQVASWREGFRTALT